VLGGGLAERDRVTSSGLAGSRMVGAPGLRLSAEEERALVVATERGDGAACRQLVELFLPAIASVARRFAGRGDLRRTELVQEGVAALLFAARRYDPRRDTPFWGYASFWVRKALQKLVAQMSRPAALSDHAVRALARIKAARRQDGRDPVRQARRGSSPRPWRRRPNERVQGLVGSTA
jgi:RNA polymerase primary sigma factor